MSELIACISSLFSAAVRVIEWIFETLWTMITISIGVVVVICVVKAPSLLTTLSDSTSGWKDVVWTHFGETLQSYISVVFYLTSVAVAPWRPLRLLFDIVCDCFEGVDDQNKTIDLFDPLVTAEELLVCLLDDLCIISALVILITLVRIPSSFSELRRLSSSSSSSSSSRINYELRFAFFTNATLSLLDALCLPGLLILLFTWRFRSAINIFFDSSSSTFSPSSSSSSTISCYSSKGIHVLSELWETLLDLPFVLMGVLLAIIGFWRLPLLLSDLRLNQQGTSASHRRWTTFRHFTYILLDLASFVAFLLVFVTGYRFLDVLFQIKSSLQRRLSPALPHLLRITSLSLSSLTSDPTGSDSKGAGGGVVLTFRAEMQKENSVSLSSIEKVILFLPGDDLWEQIAMIFGSTLASFAAASLPMSFDFHPLPPSSSTSMPRYLAPSSSSSSSSSSSAPHSDRTSLMSAAEDDRIAAADPVQENRPFDFQLVFGAGNNNVTLKAGQDTLAKMNADTTIYLHLQWKSSSSSSSSSLSDKNSLLTSISLPVRNLLHAIESNTSLLPSLVTVDPSTSSSSNYMDVFHTQSFSNAFLVLRDIVVVLLILRIFLLSPWRSFGFITRILQSKARAACLASAATRQQCLDLFNKHGESLLHRLAARRSELLKSGWEEAAITSDLVRLQEDDYQLWLHAFFEGGKSLSVPDSASNRTSIGSVVLTRNHFNAVLSVPPIVIPRFIPSWSHNTADDRRKIIYDEVSDASSDTLAAFAALFLALTLYRIWPTWVGIRRQKSKAFRRQVIFSQVIEIFYDIAYLLLALVVIAFIRHSLAVISGCFHAIVILRSVDQARFVVRRTAKLLLDDFLALLSFLTLWNTYKFTAAILIWGALTPSDAINRVLARLSLPKMIRLPLALTIGIGAVFILPIVLVVTAPSTNLNNIRIVLGAFMAAILIVLLLALRYTTIREDYTVVDSASTHLHTTAANIAAVTALLLECYQIASFPITFTSDPTEPKSSTESFFASSLLVGVDAWQIPAIITVTITVCWYLLCSAPTVVEDLLRWEPPGSFAVDPTWTALMAVMGDGLQLTVVVNALRIVDCVKSEDEQDDGYVLAEYPQVRCFRGRHSIWAAVVLVCLAFFVITSSLVGIEYVHKRQMQRQRHGRQPLSPQHMSPQEKLQEIQRLRQLRRHPQYQQQQQSPEDVLSSLHKNENGKKRQLDIQYPVAVIATISFSKVLIATGRFFLRDNLTAALLLFLFVYLAIAVFAGTYHLRHPQPICTIVSLAYVRVGGYVYGSAACVIALWYHQDQSASEKDRDVALLLVFLVVLGVFLLAYLYHSFKISQQNRREGLISRKDIAALQHSLLNLVTPSSNENDNESVAIPWQSLCSNEKNIDEEIAAKKKLAIWIRVVKTTPLKPPTKGCSDCNTLRIWADHLLALESFIDSNRIAFTSLPRRAEWKKTLTKVDINLTEFQSALSEFIVATKTIPNSAIAIPVYEPDINWM